MRQEVRHFDVVLDKRNPLWVGVMGIGVMGRGRIFRLSKDHRLEYFLEILGRKKGPNEERKKKGRHKERKLESESKS